MNRLFLQFFLHILKVHPPNAVFIPLQRAEYHIVAIIAETSGKSDICRGVKQYLVPLGAEYIQCTDYAAQHAVLISDAFPVQPLYAMPLLLPADDRIIIFLLRIKITIQRMSRPLRNPLGNRRNRGKIHVRHPHGNPAESLLHLYILIRDYLRGNSILSVPVNNIRKIVFHLRTSLLLFMI